MKKEIINKKMFHIFLYKLDKSSNHRQTYNVDKITFSYFISTEQFLNTNKRQNISTKFKRTTTHKQVQNFK